MSTSAPHTEIAIHRRGARPADGLLHRHDACASAARRARSRASSGTTCRPTARQFRQGRLLRPHRRSLGARRWRHVRFVELFEPSPQLTRGGAACARRRRRGQVRRSRPPADSTWSTLRRPRGPRGRRRGRAQDGRLGVHVRRLQALHERGLPRRLPDRRADPHRVRDGGAAARRLQRLRLLRPGVPVRRRRPRPRGRPRRQVHALLRPPRGRPRARVREGLPDRLDPVRPLRGAGRDRLAPRRRRCTRAASRAPTSTAPATSPDEQLAGGLGAFFLLTEPPERYGLPAQADSPIQENVRARPRSPRSAPVCSRARGARRVRRPRSGAAHAEARR